MRLRYTPQAIRHLDAIAEYISKHNPEAARRAGARIREVIDLLRIFPLIGHAGALSGTRELIVPSLPYIIVYRLEHREENTLVILGIYHGAQLRPGLNEPSSVFSSA